MFDKLVELIQEWIGLLRFGVIVKEYEEGVVLRWGRYHRTIGPGFHWLIPFAVDDAIHDGTVTRTSNTSNQSLTTKDDVTILIRAVLRWRIRDIKKALLEVEGLDDATKDIVYALIEREVKTHTWAEIRGEGFTDELTKRARKIGWRYGIEVEQLAFSDLSRTKSLTLNQN